MQETFLCLHGAQEDDPSPSRDDIVDALAPNENHLLPGPSHQDLLKLLFAATVAHAAEQLRPYPHQRASDDPVLLHLNPANQRCGRRPRRRLRRVCHAILANLTQRRHRPAYRAAHAATPSRTAPHCRHATHASSQNAPRAALRDQRRTLAGPLILACKASGRRGFQGRVADHTDKSCRVHGTCRRSGRFGCRRGRGQEEMRGR